MTQTRPTPDRRALELELLALRCRRGERAGWALLVAQFERPLLYYLRRMLRSEDEDWCLFAGHLGARVHEPLDARGSAQERAPRSATSEAIAEVLEIRPGP
jgi:hypothetical protein